MKQIPNLRNSAFTLVELSIVLVIIALVIGGIVLGRDLIQGSAIRATISQLNQFNAAMNTFRLKYDAMPGDMGSAKAAQFAFSTRPTSSPYGCGYGNENGIINSWNITWATSCNTSSGYVQFGEPMMFWVDLSAANLIPYTFNTATMLANPASIAETTTPGLRDYYPPAKLGGGNYFFAFSTMVSSGAGSGGVKMGNYLGLANITQAVFWMGTTQLSMSIAQAYAIDSKVDDGLALSGGVLAKYVASNMLHDMGDGYTGCNQYGSSYATGMKTYGHDSVTCALIFKFP